MLHKSETLGNSYLTINFDCLMTIHTNIKILVCKVGINSLFKECLTNFLKCINKKKIKKKFIV